MVFQIVGEIANELELSEMKYIANVVLCGQRMRDLRAIQLAEAKLQDITKMMMDEKEKTK